MYGGRRRGAAFRGPFNLQGLLEQVYHSGVWGEASWYKMQDMMILNLCHSGSFYKSETVILKETLYNIHGA